VTESMRLELRSGELVLQHLTDDTLTLAEIGLRDGMNIHVVDKDDKERDDEDDKDVAFQLSSEEYAQREGLYCHLLLLVFIVSFFKFIFSI